jgi:hypothetical protein
MLELFYMVYINMFVEPASKSPLIVSDRTVYLAKIVNYTTND